MKTFTSDKPKEQSKYFQGVYIRPNLVALENGQIVNCTNIGTEGQKGKFQLDDSQFPTAVQIALTQEEEPKIQRDPTKSNALIESDHLENTQGYQYDNCTTYQTPDGVITTFTFQDSGASEITTDFIADSLHLYLKKASGGDLTRLIEGVDYTQDSYGFTMASYTPQTGDIFVGDFRTAYTLPELIRWEDINGE